MGALSLLVACTKNRPPVPKPTPDTGGWMSLCQERPSINPAAVTPGLRQDVAHASFGPPANKGAVPTNQWWSSLLSTHAEALWAQPLVVSWTNQGIALAVPRPHAVANTIFAGQTSPLVVVMPDVVPKVDSFGDFHVVASLTSGGGASGALTVAQGSPATWLRVGKGGLIIDAPDRSTFRSGSGKDVSRTTAFSTDEVRISAPDGSGWTVVLPKKATWKHEGRRVRADIPAGLTVGLVARPQESTKTWNAVAKRMGQHPVTGTLAAWKRQPGSVIQRLTWVGDPGAIALLPHQAQAYRKALGVFASPRGDMPVIAGSSALWEAPLPGVLFGVPTFAPTVARAVAKELATDSQPPVPAGAYFGPKAIGRMATQTDLAVRADPARAAAMLDRLGKELENPGA